jgi:hypothetical protein
MPQTHSARLPDFKQQIDRAGKLDQVDPTVADLIVRSGLADGNRSDDVVSVTRGSWPASSLKPSQTSMVLEKALGMALLMLKTGKVGGDLGALVSKDKHILDGHHRWAATILASGSKGKVGGYGANLNGADLLKVLNVISKGMFAVRGGKAGKGSLADFTPDKVRALLEDFVQNGIGGPFPWSPESVQNTLEQAFGSVEAGVDQISKNASLVSKSVPSWAPDRKQMPVIEPEQVPAAANALNQGEVDWNNPHRKEGATTLTASDRDRLIRFASSLPKGDESRRAILAGLRTAEKFVKKAESVRLRRPIRIRGEKYTEAEFEVNRRSIYIELRSDDGEMVFAEKREDLSDPSWLQAAEDDVRDSLLAGSLPDGFSERDF